MRPGTQKAPPLRSRAQAGKSAGSRGKGTRTLSPSTPAGPSGSGESLTKRTITVVAQKHSRGCGYELLFRAPPGPDSVDGMNADAIELFKIQPKYRSMLFDDIMGVYGDPLSRENAVFDISSLTDDEIDAWLALLAGVPGVKLPLTIVSDDGVFRGIPSESDTLLPGSVLDNPALSKAIAADCLGPRPTGTIVRLDNLGREHLMAFLSSIGK